MSSVVTRKAVSFRTCTVCGARVQIISQMEIPIDMDHESVSCQVPLSRSIDDFALAQGRDLRRIETELGEYLVGLLTETGRMMLKFGQRA